jgi:hypothetical protein
MTILCLYLAITPASTIAFDRIESAHAGLSAATLTANSRTTGLAQDLSAKYVMSYRWPDELHLTAYNGASGALISDRYIEPTRTIDYDRSLGQYTAKKREGGEPLGKSLANLEKELDDLLLAYTDPKGFGAWMADMRKLPNWRLTSDRAKFTLSYKRDDKKIVLEAYRSNATIKKVDITTGNQRLLWDVSYARSVTGLAFNPPTGVYEVPVFDRALKPPKFADRDAERLAKKVFDAYSSDRMSALGYEVARDSGITKVQMRGSLLNQEDSTAKWSYDGKRLTYFDKRTKKWSGGDLSFTDVIDAVASLGTRVDPTASLLYRRMNPYRKRLGDGSTVKVVGSLKLDGKDVSILEAENDNAIVTLFVQPDGLVAGSSMRAKQSTGDPDEGVDLRYKYFTVPKTGLKLVPPVGAKPTVLKPASAS